MTDTYPPLPPSRDGSISSSASIGPISTPKESSPIQDTVQHIANRQLQPSESVNSAPLKNKSISPKSEIGLVNTIISFFNRHFLPITPAEYEQANKIKQKLRTLQEDVLQFKNSIRKTLQSEKQISGEYPSQKSIDLNFKNLSEHQLLLKQAQTHLNELREQEPTVKKLAEDHAIFDALPIEMQKLELQVLELEGRVEVTEKLLEIEKAMKNYQPDQTWEQFIGIKDKRSDLVTTLKNLIARHPILQKDEEIKKIVNQPIVNAREIYQLTKAFYPRLKGNIARLLDYTVVNQNQRIQNLNKKTETFKSLIEDYNKLKKEIVRLEKSIYNPSALDKFVQLLQNKASRLKNKEDFENQLEQTREKLKSKLQEIEKSGIFNPNEIVWFNKTTRLDPEYQSLRKTINKKIPSQIQYFKTQENISQSLDDLFTQFRYYGYLKKVTTSGGESATEALKNDIKENIQKLANSLPAKFKQLDFKNGLKKLIPFFPTLTPKIHMLLDKLKLDNTLNEVIQAASQQIPAQQSAPKETPIQPIQPPLPPPIQEEIIAIQEEIIAGTPVTTPVPTPEEIPVASPLPFVQTRAYENIDGEQHELSPPPLHLANIRAGMTLKRSPGLKVQPKKTGDLLEDIKTSGRKSPSSEDIDAKIEKTKQESKLKPEESKKEPSDMASVLRKAMDERRGVIEGEPEGVEDEDENDW